MIEHLTLPPAASITRVGMPQLAGTWKLLAAYFELTPTTTTPMILSAGPWVDGEVSPIWQAFPPIGTANAFGTTLSFAIGAALCGATADQNRETVSGTFDPLGTAVAFTVAATPCFRWTVPLPDLWQDASMRAELLLGGDTFALSTAVWTVEILDGPRIGKG